MGYLLLLTFGMALIAYVVTGYAVHWKLMVNEVSDRSNHVKPTSRAGGVVILALVGVIVAFLTMAGQAPPPPFIVILALAAGLVGAVDDVRSLPPILKLGMLSFLSIAAAVSAGPVDIIPLPWGGEVALPGFVAIPLTAFFILGFVNAFNFMDGLNGMAAGAGIIGCAVLVALGGGGSGGFIIAALLVASAVFGFSIRNIRAGSIFLGDAGSLAIGFFLGAGAVEASGHDPMKLYVFMTAFLPFLLDTGLTLIKRWLAGNPILEAHKEHFYQRLRTQGWSHQAVALTYISMMIGAGVLACGACTMGASWLVWVICIMTAIVYGAIIRWMFKRAALPN